MRRGEGGTTRHFCGSGMPININLPIAFIDTLNGSFLNGFCILLKSGIDFKRFCRVRPVLSLSGWQTVDGRRIMADVRAGDWDGLKCCCSSVGPLLPFSSPASSPSSLPPAFHLSRRSEALALRGCLLPFLPAVIFSSVPCGHVVRWGRFLRTFCRLCIC